MKRRTKNPPAPTSEQLEALKGYAAWAGDEWKRSLSTDWMRAGSRWSGSWGLLQQLRNSHGPAWLNTFTLEAASE